MAVDVVVPSMGESVTTATISRWKKKVGDAVKVDEALVEVDSDKASVEVPSPVAGRIVELLVAEGAEVAIGQAIVRVEEGAVEESAPAAAPVAAAASSDAGKPAPSSPSVRSAAREVGVDVTSVAGSGPGGRVTKADVSAAAQKPVASAPVLAKAVPVASAPVLVGDEPEEIVPMTTLRKRIAERLVQAQSTAAILTTFNEVDMSAIMELRERYQDRFTKKYGVKLGFMSFFVKAAIEALKAIPAANAEIRGNDIVYKHYYHMGVAVSGARGLVVPVLRNADQLNFAETEIAIAKFGQKARDNQLSIDEMQGGTFTISNGGIFGSMMSTPILNPPQVAILGMHAIQKRAVVVNDEIVIRPMMYLAVSYDHRLLDGREAVTFLVRIKECLEAPERMLLEI